MGVTPTKGSLSTPREQMLELMQRIGFGRIEGIVIRDGQPVLNPPPRVVCQVKFGGANGPRQELQARDFVLQAQAVELFEHFGRLGNGTVERVEIRHGLPVFMEVVGTVSA